MGDLSIDQVSTAPSTDYYDAVKNTSLFPEHSPPSGSSVNGFSFHFVTFTSYLSCRLIRFLEDLVARDVGSWHDSGQHAPAPPLCSNYRSTSTSGLADVIFCTNQLASGGRETYVEENLRVNTSCEIVESNRSFWNGTSIFQGLLFPLFGFRFAWRLAFTCLRCSFLGVRKTHYRMRSLISRVQRTLRGSSEDIGWLQQMQGMPPVEDGTSRFMELLRSIRNGKHTLPNSMVYLLIPGLFSNHSPLYFVNTKRFFSKMGLACHIAKIHSEASVEQNAWEIKQYIEELYWGSGKRVLLLGHSKGGVDAAAALSIYWSDLREKVSGLALVQSPYGGSPIASDILREGQIADVETRRLMELIICKLIKGDMQALEDLTYDKRKEFISKYELPAEVPIVSFHTEASVAPDVLATMLLIAHAELPWLPNIPGFCQEEADSGHVGRKLPVVIPLGAAMAVCALHLQLRYGEKSDGLVTCRDAEVPGSIVVTPDRKLDHAWMVHSAWKKDPNEPDAAEMCEALLTLLVEIGQKKLGITENI